MKIVVASLAMLLCAGTLFAQQGPFNRGIPPGEIRAEQLNDYLGLTDDQISALKELRSEFREAVLESRRQVAELVRQLRQAMKADPIDSSFVSQLRDDIEIQQNNIKDLRTNYRVSAQDNILTEDQVSLLTNLEQALELLPAARQAIGLNLIEGPEGLANRVGGRQLRNRFGMGPMTGPGRGKLPLQ